MVNDHTLNGVADMHGEFSAFFKENMLIAYGIFFPLTFSHNEIKFNDSAQKKGVWLFSWCLQNYKMRSCHSCLLYNFSSWGPEKFQSKAYGVTPRRWIRFAIQN